MGGGLKRGRQDPLKYLNLAWRKWGESENIPTFNLHEITESDTVLYISKLGNTTACGMDGLDSLSVKVAEDLLKGPITHIINTSIQNSTYANKWKLSKLIPVLKSKDASKLEPASFRPVALLPTLSKLVERTIQIQLQQHFERHELFNQNCHAYRSNLSTSTAILQMVDSLYTATDANLISQLMSIDQSSAFDCVNHDILIKKLCKYGCSNSFQAWIQSYLQFCT